MIHSSIRMVIPIKKRAETLAILRSVGERTKYEPGCISCRLYEGVENRQVIFFEEFWEDNENLDRHLRSKEYQKVLLAAEMALDRPEIRFDHISSTSGIERIEKARAFQDKTSHLE